MTHVGDTGHHPEPSYAAEKVCTCRPLGGQHVTGCALRVPLKVPAVSMLDEGRAIIAANQRLVVLDVISTHRRVNNVRRCSAKGCAWRPTASGRNGDPEAMLERHRQFNEHLSDTIVDRLSQL